MQAILVHLVQDLRFALRQMRRAPGFAIITVLTLALGIGAATAVFSVMDATLIRPLPFNHAERILSTLTRSVSGYTQPFSAPDFQDIRDRFRTLEAFAGYNTDFVNLQLPSGPVPLHALRGSDNIFRVFGSEPLLGRTFLPGEDQPGRNDVAVLSYELWKQQFAGDRNAIGRSVDLDGHPTVIVGVMNAGFRFPMSNIGGIYTPFHLERRAPQTVQQQRGSHWMQSLGRMKPGVTRAEAEAEFRTIMADLARAYPNEDAGRTGSFIPLDRLVLGNTSGALWTLAGAVAALLLIACVNVTGLLLARAVKREREVALRSAVGASRSRLLQQVVTESLLMAIVSALIGLALAYALVAAMRSFLVTALQRGADVHINGTALLASIGFAVLTGVVASVLPALRLSSLSPNGVLKSGGSSGTNRRQHRLRAGFIVAQVTLSLTLLVIAGLLLQSLSRLRSAPLGFDADHILTAELNLSLGHYENRDPIATFYGPLLDRLSHAPGVEGAGVINILPVQSWGSNMDVQIAGRPPAPKDREMLAETRIVSEGYFNAMGVQLHTGRLLSSSLDRSSEQNPKIVVNEAFVHKFFSDGTDPLHKRLVDNDKPEKYSEIVGVTSGVRQDLNQPSMPELEWLIDSIPQKDLLGNVGSMSLVIRTAGNPRDFVPQLRGILHDVDATIPLRLPETMREVIAESLTLERMEGWLFGIFAALAVLLAMAGLYGLISHEVELGTRDIGVRMALGSTRGRVVTGILRRVTLLTALGTVFGIALTLATRQVFRSVVELHATHDALLIGALAAAMILLGIAAALLPARRAAAIEPMQALRME